MKTLRLLLVCLGLVIGNNAAQSQQMPQDNWVYNGKKTPGNFRCLHIAKDNRIYVGSTNKIAVLDTDLNFITEFGTVGTVLGIASDSQTNIYVLEASTVKVFNPATGALINQWGSAGSGDGQFTVPAVLGSNGQTGQPQTSGIAIDQSDNVYISNSGGKVLVMSTSGDFIRTWGPNVFRLTHVIKNSCIGLSHDGNVVLLYDNPNSASFTVFQLFRPDGTFLVSAGLDTANFANGGRQIAYTPDKRLAICYAPNGTGSSEIRIEHPSLGTSFLISTLNTPYFLNDMGITGATRSDGMGFSAQGDLFLLATSYSSGQFGTPRGICRFDRTYVNNQSPIVNPIPQPRLISVTQRPSSSLVDIDYCIVDPNSPNVDVAILAFTNGVQNTLAGIIKLNTFIDNGLTNFGPNKVSNTTNRVTWDAAADWNVGFGNIQFELLARDERGLWPFHFITIPAGSGGTEPLIMTDRAFLDSDLIHIWFWLVASNDSEIQFTNGEIFGVGVNSSVKYATGATTTAQGRAYLLNRLGVRAPTTAEAARASSGRYGFVGTVTTTSGHVVKLP